MGKSKFLHSVLSFKWLTLRKFAFLYPLRTGVQVYGFISFILSIVIADVFFTKLIDQQVCAVYRSKNDLLQATRQSQCLITKHIILPQACQALMSALLLCCVKRSFVPLCWLGCKFAVTVMEFSYILDWTKEFFAIFFNLHLQLAWIAVPFICIYVYGILVSLSYYAELVGNQASYNFSSNKEDMETNVDIPVPPALPNF